jgi:hypothetical protein
MTVRNPRNNAYAFAASKSCEGTWAGRSVGGGRASGARPLVFNHESSSAGTESFGGRVDTNGHEFGSGKHFPFRAGHPSFFSRPCVTRFGFRPRYVSPDVPPGRFKESGAAARKWRIRFAAEAGSL